MVGIQNFEVGNKIGKSFFTQMNENLRKNLYEFKTQQFAQQQAEATSK